MIVSRDPFVHLSVHPRSFAVCLDWGHPHPSSAPSSPHPDFVSVCWWAGIERGGAGRPRPSQTSKHCQTTLSCPTLSLSRRWKPPSLRSRQRQGWGLPFCMQVCALMTPLVRTPLVHTCAHQGDQLDMQLSGSPDVTALLRPWPERIVFLAWEVELLTRSCQSGRERWRPPNAHPVTCAPQKTHLPHPFWVRLGHRDIYFVSSSPCQWAQLDLCSHLVASCQCPGYKCRKSVKEYMILMACGRSPSRQPSEGGGLNPNNLMRKTKAGREATWLRPQACARYFSDSELSQCGVGCFC